MTRRPALQRRRWALLAAAVFALTVAPGAARAHQGCPGGVTVVVDFGAFGGEVDARCVEGAPASGLAALEEAGFTVTMVQSQPGFVCRIDGEPSDDTCDRTPPADAYWAYWHADADTSWGYATAGAVSRVPAEGAIEGWAFATPAEDGPPSIAPEEAAATASAAGTTATTGEAPDGGDGSPVGVVVGAGVLAALVAAVVVSALRRSRR